MLQAEGIRKDYPTRSGSLKVLRGATITLETGASAAILGPSGSGKSTLLNILGTLDVPTAGDVTIDGSNPFALDERELARFRNRCIGFVFQDHHLLPQCSVLENVLLPTLADRAARGDADLAHRLLERVGLTDRLDHRPAELSGGERQRVAVARALINAPSLVLADEPTGNLDRHTADAIADLLVELQREDQLTLLVITHSERIASRFDRRFELVDGRLVPP